MNNGQKVGIVFLAIIASGFVVALGLAHKADKYLQDLATREAQLKTRAQSEVKAKNAKIQALTQENLRLRTKLLKKAKLPSRLAIIPVQLRGGTSYISTAYTHTGNNTASGVYPRANHTIAVDRSLVPLGAKVKLRCPSMPEYDGIYTAEDTGGDIKGQRIDIFVDSRGEAINFGRRKVLIEVIK